MVRVRGRHSLRRATPQVPVALALAVGSDGRGGHGGPQGQWVQRVGRVAVAVAEAVGVAVVDALRHLHCHLLRVGRVAKGTSMHVTVPKVQLQLGLLRELQLSKRRRGHGNIWHDVR